MSGLSYKNKSIIMGVICACLVVAIGVTVFFLIDSLDGNHALEVKKENEKKLYAVVKESGSDYARVEPIEGGETVHINTNDNLKKGDFIVVTYNDDEALSITPNDIEVIAENKEVTITPNTVKITTKSVYVSTTDKKTTTTTKKTTTTKNDKTKNTINDEDIVEFARLSYEETNREEKSITASIKEKFVLLIDFIFYDGKIKGKTFSELSDKAKAKIIYYTLLVDSKIDNKWPNYKQNIGKKVADIKAKLIAKYMDITSNLCENHADGCKMVKEDFALLKKSLNLTWDTIKSAFSYGYNKTYTYLKNWYEVWREK